MGTNEEGYYNHQLPPNVGCDDLVCYLAFLLLVVRFTVGEEKGGVDQILKRRVDENYKIICFHSVCLFRLWSEDVKVLI